MSTYSDPPAVSGHVGPVGPPTPAPPGVGNVHVHRSIDYSVTTSGSPPTQQKAGTPDAAAQLVVAALHEAKRQHDASTVPNPAPVTVTVTEVIAPLGPTPR